MEIVNKYGVSLKDAELLITSINNNAVSLLLGAGASYGALGGDGVELKGGADLAEELNKHFGLGLEKPDSSDLPLVYGDLESEPSRKSSVNSFFIKRFTRCTPSWQPLLKELPWKRIWTLNIDDILDKSFEAQRTDSYLWCDGYKPRDLGDNTLQVIYLHGKASKLGQQPNSLIFSLSEYLSRSENTPGWHAEFKSDWVKKPFVVCGARLQEEFDLETVLNFGNKSRERGGCPSFIVLSSFAAGQAERYRKRGLIPIESKGIDFFKSLATDLSNWHKQNPSHSPEFDSAREEVKEKFKQLRFDLPSAKRVLDFYAAAESRWEHIVNNLDYPFEESIACSKWISSEEASKTRVALIYGGTVSGKSSATLRIGAELLSQGYEVWHFRSESRFDENALVNYSKNRKCAFIFDDCADFSSSLRGTIEKSLLSGIKLRIVTACDQHRLRAVRADISEADTKEIALEPISRKNFIGIFNKRNEKGRLGKLSNVEANEAWKLFKADYSGRFLEWLESLENAHSYRDAIKQLLTDPSYMPHGAMRLVVAVAAVHKAGYSLPYHIGDDLSGRLSLEEIFAEGSPMGDIGYLDDRGVRLRSAAFSKFVWDQVPSDLKYSITLSVARMLAPLVVPQSIASRSVPYLILRSLMDHTVVREDLGKEADKWFAELEPSCGWNARFWEQRALLASDEGNDIPAYSYAKKAISILERDSFPHTTLGKICVKIGISRKDAVGVERFWEGVNELKISRELSAEKNLEWEHPYTAFFSYALKAVKEPHFSSEIDRISINWKEWMRAAKSSKTLAFDHEGRSSLDNFERQWLLNSVKTQ